MEGGRPRELMVKVPGTEAGVPAIRTLIAEGININVTLLFAQSTPTRRSPRPISPGSKLASPRAASVADRQRRQLLRQPHRRA